MKTNRKLQLIAAAAAILAINPSARAQTPAPLSDEMLLHALATGQIPTSQLGAGGGDDENVASRGTVSAVTSYGGGVYFQGQPTANYGGAMYYGGAIYNATEGAAPVNSWYNDFYGKVSAPNPDSGFKDSDGTTADLHTTATTYGGVVYLQGDGGSYGGSLYLQGQTTSAQLGAGGGDDDALLQQPGMISGYPGFYYGDFALQNNGPATAAYGGGVYNTTAGSPPVNSWYNDFYGNIASQGPASGFKDADGTSALRPTTASYGGAIYHSTGSSLYGEDFPGDALVGEDFPGDALWGEDLPGEQLTDAQLDALILESLAGVMDWDICPTPLTSGRTAGICDQDDNCPVAPMPR